MEIKRTLWSMLCGVIYFNKRNEKLLNISWRYLQSVDKYRLKTHFWSDQ